MPRTSRGGAPSSASSRPRSTPACNARGTSSAVSSRASWRRSSGRRSWAFADSGSARASVSSWLIRWALRTALSCTRCRRCTSSGSLASRKANSVWLLSPASGVRSWCAASLMKRFCTATLCCTSVRSVLMARASARTSGGAALIWIGARSLAARPSTCRCKAVSGARPARMPAPTIIVINSIRPESGSTMSSRICRASSSRLALERATCTSSVWPGLPGSP